MTLQTAVSSFGHGVHPQEHKAQTEHLPIERMPFVDRFILPISQHIGAPAEAIVKVGQSVLRGEQLAAPGGFVSAALHSPVTGHVDAVHPNRHPNGSYVPCIEIVADPYASQAMPVIDPTDVTSLALDDFIAQVQTAGLVGMGGAAFPSHVKYKLPEGKRCERLVINGCECEPYLTCDHRVMVEWADGVVRGTHMLATQLHAEEVWLGVELNKPDAIAALEHAVAEHGHSMQVAGLKVKYPQGAEKMLIKALFDEEVPAGKLPLDLNIVVNNVATMAALADWFERGQPLIERVVTVSGPGVDRPANLLVPLGTPVRDVLRHCGLKRETRQVIMGGPMMGQPLATLDVPVMKGTSGLLAFTDDIVEHPNEYACVKCGRCLEACGNFLNPQRMARLARAGRHEELEQLHIMDCVECGACTFTCPSGVPVVHLIRAAKAAIRDGKAKPS